MKLSTIILQKLDSLNSAAEFRACLTFAMMNDVKIIRVSFEDLDGLRDVLKRPDTLPVGSVEFLSKAFNLAQKQIPAPLSYPDCFVSATLQKPVLVSKKDIKSEHFFVKPFRTKLFTGFCLNNINEDNLADYHTYTGLDENEQIWVSPIMNIAQEWRMYIQNNSVIGYARYDDTEAEDENPLDFTESVLKHSTIPHPYCIDVGLSQEFGWTVIEVNDAWALGLYGKALSNTQYVEFLHERWLSL